MNKTGLNQYKIIIFLGICIQKLDEIHLECLLTKLKNFLLKN